MSGGVVTEELQLLWSLRDLDDRMVTLEAALRRYPGERKLLEARTSGEKARLETHRQRLHDLQLRHRQFEKDVEALQAEERKFQSQLPMVKKNEEYQALLKEIGERKGRRSDRETELLVLMDEEQRLNGERPALEQALKTAESEAAGRLQAIAAEEQVEREQVAGLERERQALLDRLPAGIRTRYERIRVSKEGRAVVPIIKGSCGGCYRGQPPQALQEARRGDRVLTCDGCGRLLIWPPEGV
jgi:predicted  nucleic acid-binding Zn-ribbon protein